MEQDPPPGMVRVYFVTQYGIQVTHGFVLLGLRADIPNSSERLQQEYGLEAKQAIEIGKALQAHGEELLSRLSP